MAKALDQRLQRVAPGTRAGSRRLTRLLPILEWLPHYRREDLGGDAIAGLIVAIMLVPQGMAYALLAGLPPEMGLYAGVFPIFIYGLLGTSRVLAVGPVAIVSLLVASTLGGLAEAGTADYVGLAVTLALLCGVIQLVMGALRLGGLVKFMSHPVLTGFIHAAALIIGASQLRNLLGLSIPGSNEFGTMIGDAVGNISHANGTTTAIGLGSIAVLLSFGYGLGGLLRRRGVAERRSLPIVKSAHLLVVFVGTILVWGFALNESAGVKIVGVVPSGMPPFAVPTLDGDVLSSLLPGAAIITIVGFMESISVAKVLGGRRRQRVDANQEVLALGAASVGAAFTGAYPVTGSFSRTIVNFAAGANTLVASLITGALMVLSILFLSPLFFFLPQTVLASIIIVAVVGLIDVPGLKRIWSYSKADAASMVLTFVSVLALGVEAGLALGVVSAIALYLARTSRPRVVMLGRLVGTESYGDVQRFEVVTFPHVVALRIDESLYFANTKTLEESVLGTVADRPEMKHLVLIGSGINSIDSSALQTLEGLVEALRDSGVEMHIAGFRAPVLDRLRVAGFTERIGEDHIFRHTHDAMKALDCV
jgi:SulP family sulfate permease